MNRVIITGGNGFIGRHLTEKILSYNPESVVLISKKFNSNAKKSQAKRYLQDKSLRFYTADIRDKKTISDIFRAESPETCIHLAAKVGLSTSIKDPNETMDINVNGTINMLEACYTNNVNNFVFASSAAVYGQVKELPIREEYRLEPLSLYGTSKMLAEKIVLSYNRLKKIQNTAILRIFNPYGHGQNSQLDVITRFAARLKNGLPPIIYGEGAQTRDFISVDDIVEAILLSIAVIEDEKGQNRNKFLDLDPVFNLGTGRPTSIRELAHKMISISTLELQPIYIEAPGNKNEAIHSYANTSKSKEILGFVAKKRIETGLREIMKQMDICG